MITNGSGRVRIEHRLAIHQKPILMVAMRQMHLGKPPAIHRRRHGEGVPMIEIAHERDGFCGRGGAKEVDRLVGVVEGFSDRVGMRLRSVHKE